MAIDAQTIVDSVAATDETTALSILQAVIQSRPEFAAPIAVMLVPDLTYPPARALTEKRASGTIKSLNELKGYGFIDCPELHAIFGCDVFIHYKQAIGMSQGQNVTFAVMLNKDMKPQGYDLQLEGGFVKGASKGMGKPSGGGESSEDMMQMMMQMMMGEAGGEAFGAQGACGKGAGKGKQFTSGEAKPNVVEVVGEFQGMIKSFNPKSGYGFIECPDLKEVGCPNDVFLHHAQLNGFEKGSHVQFTCYMNRNGQPQAKDLMAVQGDTKKLKAF